MLVNSDTLGMRRQRLKDVYPFDNPRQVSERTDPDYLEKKIIKMSSEILALEPMLRVQYFVGLDLKDRKEILEYLSRWPRAEAVMMFVEEARRCLLKAHSPDGAVCVAGKGLDCLLQNLNLGLKGMLGSKLRTLERLAEDPTLKYRLSDRAGLVRELTGMWSLLETRNLGAHYDPRKPRTSDSEAGTFIKKIEELYRLECSRQATIALQLQNQTKIAQGELQRRRQGSWGAAEHHPFS